MLNKMIKIYYFGFCYLWITSMCMLMNAEHSTSYQSLYGANIKWYYALLIWLILMIVEAFIKKPFFISMTSTILFLILRTLKYGFGLQMLDTIAIFIFIILVLSLMMKFTNKSLD